MNHEEARTILSDLLAGQLEESEAASAWEHVAACLECRQVLPVVFQVRSAVATRGAAVFSAHPPAEDIVLFATADPELSTPAMARIGSHVRSCPDCQSAVELTRRADAATGSTRKPARGVARIPRSVLMFAPALAIVVALLAYPAYRGIVVFPELQRAHETTARDLEKLQSDARELRGELARRVNEPKTQSWAGPMRLLFLPATTRGTPSEPAVEHASGRLYQPIVVQHRPFAGDRPEGTIEVSVLRDNDEKVWSEQRPVSDWWDSAHASLVLLVPAAVLEPGRYRLEIRRDGEPSYASAFIVTPPSAAARNR